MEKFTDDYLDSLSHAELFNLWASTDEGKAQEKLNGALIDLLNHPDIRKSENCIRFIQIMQSYAPTAGGDIDESVESLRAAFAKLQAYKSATKGHAISNAAKEFVRSEWKMYKNEYKNNKSEFARIYVKRVFNEYCVTITEKQMREVWLKNTPPASKPDGMPAGG